MTLLAVMAAIALLSLVVLKTTVAAAFADLEMESAARNVVRVERAIQNDLRNLGAVVGDWAPWDDAYSYALGRNPGFPKSNLNLSTMMNLDLDLLLIFNNDGDVLWRHLLLGGVVANQESLSIFERDNPNFAALVLHSRIDSEVEGFVQTVHGPMLLSSRPIITSDREGPIAGTMVMGRFFDATSRVSLQQRTEVALTWHLLQDDPVIEGVEAEEILAASDGSYTYVVHDDVIEAFGLLRDLHGAPMMILEVDTPRQISALGSRTVNGALVFMSVAGIVIALVTWILLRRIIVSPLERLANHITGIRESGDLTRRLNEDRHDEIGILAGKFDQMTLEVHDARRQLLDQSFKAGKADTAAEVLHNIRNAMTPLINGIDRLSRNFKAADNLRVQQATGELASEDCPADRRGKLLQYVESAFKHVRQSGEEALRELELASRQAKQIESILSDQERFANVAPVVEALELGSLVDEAALVMPKSGPRVRLTVSPDIGKFKVLAHRVRLQQVLGNLILNAFESIERSGAKTGIIDVSAALADNDDEAAVRISVRDSGAGFDEGEGDRIFRRGYSSKDGHMSGLGLHWCANALHVMGGRIMAESAGAGAGAAFHVLLPMVVEHGEAAAANGATRLAAENHHEAELRQENA